ncbi:hypothetical protein GDO78_022251 [Eleutherodactylus coqui]|uniref:Sulfotransferase n=1 Tax=Eleutherodactylus coqui TaxID=57060 RepID=A0A8J6E501_ELECQ|nr:hypothetical protein GDO78_022251 [Eleutherodactylus coqui]
MMEAGRQYIEFEHIRVPAAVHTMESFNYAWKEFETRDDDVFNVTYPKSGTTWLQEILSLIYSNGDPTPVKTAFSWDRVPWIEQHGGRTQLENRPSPRLITTHLPFHLFTQSFFKTKAKVIYTIRNPKDVCVSLYYFSRMVQFMEYRDDFQDFVSLFLSKDSVAGDHKNHFTPAQEEEFEKIYKDCMKDVNISFT